MNRNLLNLKYRYNRATVLSAMLVLSLSLAGCGTFGANMSSKQRDALAKLRYPSQVKNKVNKDIVVVRDGKKINLVNRTAHSYKNMQLWLNKEYARNVKKLSIGTDNHFNLTSFINRYRQSFPVGKFLAPDKADDLVLAELYNPKTKKMYRLFVLDPLKVDNAAKSRGQKLENMH